MKVKCQHCSEMIAIPDGFDSHTIMCPACNQMVSVIDELDLGSADDDDELNLDFDDDDDSPLDLSEAVEEVVDTAKDKLQQVAEESGLADIAHSAAGFGAGILDSADVDSESDDSSEKTNETISLSEALRTPDEELANKSIDEDDDFGLSLDDDDDELQLADDSEDSGNIVEDAVDAVEGFGAGIATGAAGLAAGAAAMAGDAVDGVSNLAGDSVEDAVNMAGDAAEAVGGLAEDAVEGAADLMDGAVDGVTELAGDAASAVGDAVGGAVDGAAGLVEGAIEGAIEGAADLASDAVESIGDAVESVGDAGGAIAGAAAAATGAIAGGALLSGGSDEDDADEDVVDLLSGDDEDDDFDLDLLGDDEPDDPQVSAEDVDEFEFESVDEEPQEASFEAEPAGTFAAAKPDDIEDTDEDGSWLSGELSADDTNLEKEDTLLEAGAASYEAEEIETPIESVGDIDTESEELEGATSSAFDLEETVDYLGPNEEEDALDAEPISAVDPFELAQTPESGATASSPTASYVPGPVPKRRSFIGNMIRGALSAVLVLFVSQMVAWWVFGTDPLGVAPKLPLLMQIAVPERLLARTPVIRKPPGTVQPIGDSDESGMGESGMDQGDDGSAAIDDSQRLATGDEGSGKVDDGAMDDGSGSSAGMDNVAPGADDLPGSDVGMGDPVADASAPTTDAISDDSVDSLLNDDDPPVEDTTSSLAGATDDGSETRAASGDASGLLDDTSGVSDSTSDIDSLLADDSPSVDDVAGGDVAVEDLGGDEDLGSLLDMDDDSSVGVSDDPGEALGAVEPPTVETASPFEGAAPTNFKPATVEQLNASVAAAQKAFDEFESARLIETKNFGAVAKQFYISHCQLAEAATLVPRQSDVLSGSQNVIDRLKGDTTKHSFLANCARGWLAKNNKPSTGVVLAGTISNVSKSGAINRLDVKLMDVRKGTPLNTPVTVVTHLNPTGGDLLNYGPGTKVLAFGVRVDDPTTNLPGYQGRDGVVVYVTDQMVVIP